MMGLSWEIRASFTADLVLAAAGLAPEKGFTFETRCRHGVNGDGTFTFLGPDDNRWLRFERVGAVFISFNRCFIAQGLHHLNFGLGL